MKERNPCRHHRAGTVDGKRSRGMPARQWLYVVQKWTVYKSAQLTCGGSHLTLWPGVILSVKLP